MIKAFSTTLIIATVLLASSANAQNNNPDTFIYLNGGYSSKLDKVVVAVSRLRSTVTPTTTQPWGGRIEIDLGEMQDNAKGNWLAQSWVSYKSGADTFIGGRIFVPGNKQTPDIFDLVTARYPNSVISQPYAWGGGWSHQFDPRVDLELSLTGATGLVFDEADQFRYLEKHFRLRYKDGADRVSLAGKSGQGFSRYGIEGKKDFLDGQFTVWAMALYRTERRPLPRPLGGYGLLEWHPWSWLHPHLQLELRNNDTEVWTKGVCIDVGPFRLIVDKNPIEKTEARIQFTTHF